jgi:3-oxoadipate enol-lactonase
VRIHYDVHGDPSHVAPTVVLVQGLGLSSRFWFDQADRLSREPDRWRVLTVDNRGVGRSDKPLGPYTMPRMADDIAAVLDHARVDRAYVVGLSLGGMIAQHVALRHPSRVAGLVLVATSAGFPHIRMPTAGALASFLSLPISGRLSKKKVDRSFARLLLGEKDLSRRGELLAGWPEALRTDRASLRIYVSHFVAMMIHSTGFRLGRVACPTVVVTGDDDILLPHHNSRMLARLMPGAHLEVVRGSGHIVPASDPECVRRALARLRTMSAGPSARQIDSAPVRSR